MFNIDNIYKTGSHSRVYLAFEQGVSSRPGNNYVWLQDCMGFTAAEQTTKSPIFGYASDLWDAVSKGPSFYTGSITVAMRNVSVLPIVLSMGEQGLELAVEDVEAFAGATTGDTADINRLKALYWGDHTARLSPKISNSMETRMPELVLMEILHTYNDKNEMEFESGKVFRHININSAQHQNAQNDSPLVKTFSFIARSSELIYSDDQDSLQTSRLDQIEELYKLGLASPVAPETE